MICVSETWSRFISYKHSAVTTLAYADNWTLWLNSNQLHLEPILDTDDFVSWMGLEISWSKTWVWSTDVEGSRKLLYMLQDFLGQEDLQALLTATDLGCQMTYHGTSKLGILHERFEQARLRLLALKHKTWVLPLKCHLVQTSVLPLALYGVELLAVGQRHFDTLRTQIADSLAGETLRSMSSTIMVNCAAKKCLDPHFHALILAVKAARKFLSRTDVTTRNAFLKILSMPTTHVGTTHGPASALHEYLQRLGLKCSSDGWIFATAFRKCHLVNDSFADLHRYLTWAWQEQLLLLHTNRKILYNLPPINTMETFRILCKFPPKKQLLLLREIAGAFQTREQQSKWNENVENKCQFCGHEGDTRVHRVFECPSFAEHRLPYHDFLHELREENPELVELPVVHWHPHYEMHDALLYAMPDAIIPPDTVALFQQIPDTELIFFTDGSCTHPTMPDTCYSAFSIVGDLCQNDLQRRDLADVFLTQQTSLSSLQTLLVGRTQGRQHIHRAELTAIIVLCESFQ